MPRYVGKVAQAQVQGAGVGTGTGGMEWVSPDVLPPPNTNSGGIFNIEVTHLDRGMHRRRGGGEKGRGGREGDGWGRKWALVWSGVSRVSIGHVYGGWVSDVCCVLWCR